MFMIAIPGTPVLNAPEAAPQVTALRPAPPALAVGGALKLEIKTLDQAEAAGWNAMVGEHPMGSVFQHTAYARMLLATFKHLDLHYLTLVDAQGAIKGGLALSLVKSWLTHNRLVAMPFAFYSDPMVESGEQMKAVFDGIVPLFRKTGARYVEIKAHRSVPLLIQGDKMTPVYYHKTYFLDLAEGLDAAWEKFHRTGVKQKIRRAESCGITVRPADSEADVRTFYDLLAVGRRRLGLPPQNWEYFQNIWRHLVPMKMVHFTMAQKGDQTVGALCSFLFKDTMYLAYIGTLEEFQPEGVGQALWWDALQKATREGFRYVDLGKTSPHDEGLITYKTRWNAIEQEVPSFYYPCPTRSAMYYDDSSKSHQWARKAWKAMPPRVARFAARAAYRHMG
jgi:CelD/BcsL family acetyltransferase involved in cellulose biosynthesis